MDLNFINWLRLFWNQACSLNLLSVLLLLWQKAILYLLSMEAPSFWGVETDPRNMGFGSPFVPSDSFCYIYIHLWSVSSFMWAVRVPCQSRFSLGRAEKGPDLKFFFLLNNSYWRTSIVKRKAIRSLFSFLLNDVRKPHWDQREHL